MTDDSTPETEPTPTPPPEDVDRLLTALTRVIIGRLKADPTLLVPAIQETLKQDAVHDRIYEIATGAAESYVDNSDFATQDWVNDHSINGDECRDIISNEVTSYDEDDIITIIRNKLK